MVEMTTLPNFILLGAARSGTTSLYTYIGQHPEIFTSSVKEPSFFAFEGSALDYRGPEDDWMKGRVDTRLEDYIAHFASVDQETAIGEASVVYLFSPDAPAQIRRHLADVRLIAILRNPVERAYSHFLYNVGQGREPVHDFNKALDLEPKRIADYWEWFWQYQGVGYYGRQLARYYELFDRDRIRVYLYDDLSANPLALLRDLFGFLEVDDTFIPDVTKQHVVSGKRRNRRIQRVVDGNTPVKKLLRAVLPAEWQRRLVNSPRVKAFMHERPPMPISARDRLRQAYRDDIRELQNLIKRDLSSWLVAD